MAPIVDGLEQTYGEQIVVKRINALNEDGPEIMRQYRIPGHPATIIFNKVGQETQRLIGPQPAEVIAEALQQALNEE